MPHPLITTYLRTHKEIFGVNLLTIAQRIMLKRVGCHWARMKSFLPHKASILDIGMGSGAFTVFLSKKGYNVIGIDVANVSMYTSVTPILYDGVTMPFPKKKFDVGVIVWVLHHCDEPEKVLREAMRVCKRVIVIENIYNNKIERFFTSIADQVSNHEFWDHAYLNRADWIKLIKKNGWRMHGSDEWLDFSYGFSFSRDFLFVIE